MDNINMSMKQNLEDNYVKLLEEVKANADVYSPDKLITILSAAVYMHRKAHEVIQNVPDVDPVKYPVKKTLEDKAVEIIRKTIDKIRENDCNAIEVKQCVDDALTSYHKAHELIKDGESVNNKITAEPSNNGEVMEESAKSYKLNGNVTIPTDTEIDSYILLIKKYRKDPTANLMSEISAVAKLPGETLKAGTVLSKKELNMYKNRLVKIAKSLAIFKLKYNVKDSRGDYTNTDIKPFKGEKRSWINYSILPEKVKTSDTITDKAMIKLVDKIIDALVSMTNVFSPLDEYSAEFGSTIQNKEK